MDHEKSKKRQVFDTLVERKNGITAEAVAELIKAPVSTVKVYLEDFLKASLHVDRGRTSEGVVFYRFDAMGVDPDIIYDSIKTIQAEKKQQLKDKLMGMKKTPEQEQEKGEPTAASLAEFVMGPSTYARPTVQQQVVELVIKLKIKVQLE